MISPLFINVNNTLVMKSPCFPEQKLSEKSGIAFHVCHSLEGLALGKGPFLPLHLVQCSVSRHARGGDQCEKTHNVPVVFRKRLVPRNHFENR